MPAGVSASMQGSVLTVKGPKGSAIRDFRNTLAHISLEGQKVMITFKRDSKRERKNVGSFRAHLNNLIKGVQEPHQYRLKICSGHFPMNVAVVNKELVIKNFFGEKTPRKVTLRPEVTVKIEGQEIILESADKEAVSTLAGAIEQATRRPGFDRRVFQDGIYITSKAGRDVK